MGLAVIAAMGTGVTMPLLIILYGEFTEVLVEHELNEKGAPLTTSHSNIHIFISSVRQTR
jgi:hypothetical protein